MQLVVIEKRSKTYECFSGLDVMSVSVFVDVFRVDDLLLDVHPVLVPFLLVHHSHRLVVVHSYWQVVVYLRFGASVMKIRLRRRIVVTVRIMLDILRRGLLRLGTITVHSLHGNGNVCAVVGMLLKQLVIVKEYRRGFDT